MGSEPACPHLGKYSEVPRDIFDYHNWEGAAGIKWVEGRDAANLPTRQRTDSSKRNERPQSGEMMPGLL